MRALQFWVLLLGSFFVSGLLIKEIFLSRELYQQEKALADNQQIASAAGPYEKAWKEVAYRMYQYNHDTALADALKAQHIIIHSTPNASPASTAPAPAPVPETSSKPPVTPAAHP